VRARRSITVLVLVTVALVVSAAIALGATDRVGVKKTSKGYAWNPSALSIKKGDTVVWSWKGNVAHNVSGPGFRSKTVARLTYSRRFTKAGSYRVVCTIHQALGQRMTIKVR
jgi:plastocyanin